MKKIISVLTFVAMLAFLIPAPAANASQNNAPNLVKGTLSGKFTRDMKGVHKYFNDNKVKFNVVDAENEFAELTSKDDNLGLRHIKTEQMVNGIPVFGGEYIVHFNKDGEVYAANGNYDPAARKTKVDKTKLLNPNKAIIIAESQVTFDSLEMVPTAKLYLYKVYNEYVPVYEVRVNFIYPTLGDWHIFVNAVNGNIVNKYNTITNAATTITGKGVLGDTKTLNADKVTVTVRKSTQTQYQLNDRTRGALISTYTANNGTRLPGSLVYSTSTTLNDPAAVDAHYYAGIVYDYYKAKFGRAGIDNRNMAMKSTVHYYRNYNNAGWTGKQMVYGDGDSINYRPFSGALDVIGHEMTHGVDTNEANLIYQNQSGALNESFSDVFGTLIEFYTEGQSGDWLCGEDICIKAGGFRSLSDPTKYGDPAHMSDYYVTTSDNGGVHTNSGIPNKAFYLTYNSIGADKAERLYYNTLCNYLTSSAQFHDARLALVQCATDLYGAGSSEVAAVNAAWNAVGVN